MRTTVDMDGFPELVISRAISLGIAKTKNEVIRMGVISFNKEYNLVNEKNIEMQMVESKLMQEEKLVKTNKIKLLTKDEFFKKYK